MNFIINLFNKWGLIIFFILVMLEYACFPLPSEVLLPFLGFMINVNDYSVVGAIVLSTIMGFIGCLLCYLVGYYGGNVFYNKIYNKFKNVKKGVDYGKEKFDKYGNISVMICRIIPLCRTYISFLSGLYKQSLFTYSLFSILGILIWNSILIVLGYLDRWGLVTIYYNKYKLVFIITILFLIAGFLLYKLYKKKKLRKNINGD